jgi:hypothetical protein
MKELDTVVLTHDIKDKGLKKGDMGAIVHIYGDSKAFEVEFVTADGKTVALLTLEQSDIRPMAKKEMLHVRDLSSISSI